MTIFLTCSRDCGIISHIYSAEISKLLGGLVWKFAWATQDENYITVHDQENLGPASGGWHFCCVACSCWDCNGSEFHGLVGAKGLALCAMFCVIAQLITGRIQLKILCPP